MKQKQIIIIFLVIFLAGAAAVGWRYSRNTGQAVAASGTLEATQAAIAPKTYGHLESLAVKEGDAIRRGQFLAKLSRQDLTSQVVRDDAALSKAQASLRDLEAGARPEELRRAGAQTAAAAWQLDQATDDWNRTSRLVSDGAVSQQTADHSRAAFEVARQNYQAALAQAQLLEAGYREETVVAQRDEVTRSRAVADGSRALLADTVLYSPLDGVVLNKNFEPGEFVATGAPVLLVADLTDCWVKIYIPSSQLGLIQLGQQAEIKVDSFPDKVFSGRIKEISQQAEFNPRQSLTQKERSNLVFAVKVSVDNENGVLKPGMPADVVFP